jgi:hypothetical protein
VKKSFPSQANAVPAGLFALRPIARLGSADDAVFAKEIESLSFSSATN